MTTGAWMVGFDFQTRENINEDLQDFVSLCPTLQQLTRVCPFPATPMWHRLREEGRIRADVEWEEVSFYGGGGMAPKNFHEHEIMEVIERGYRLLYETHGASLARMMHVSLLGYEYFMNNRRRNPYFEDRAMYHKRMAYTFFPVLKALEIYAPNNTVRKRMKDLRRMYIKLIGKPTSFQIAMERILTLASGWNRLLDVIYPRDNILVEDTFKKYIYDKPAPSYPKCPYRVEYPHRTRKFNAYLHAKTHLSRLMTGLEMGTRFFDRLQVIPKDKAIPPGTFKIFL